MKKISHLLFLVLISFTLLLSCSSRSKLTNDTLYFNLGTEPPSLDPSKATDTTSNLVIENLMDNLTDYDISTPDLKIVPKVAKSWKITEGGKVYTFTLRDDVLWTDGKKVTAQDFEYSWRRLIEPATAAEYAYFLFDIKNAKAFNEGKIKDFSKVGIKAINDHTFQITLESPVSYFLHVSTFSSLSPLRKDVIDQWGDRWTDPEHIVTNGPFKLTHWKHDYQLTLERNENYYGAKGKLKKVECFMIVEQSTALSLYQTRKLDIITQVPTLDIPKLKQTPEFHSGNFLSTYYIGLNTKKAPLNNPYVRKALASSINRNQITEMLQKGDIPTSSLIPMGMQGYNPDLGYKLNIEQAQEWMKKAGYEKKEGNTISWVHSKTKEPFPTITFIYNTNEAHKTIAEDLQAQWKKNLGITMAIDNQEWKVYNNSLQGSHTSPETAPFHLFRLGWNADYPDPDNFMSLFTSYSDNNHTHWGNSKFDSLTEKAKVILDKTKRVDMYNKAQKILLEEDTAIIPLYVYAHQSMWRDEVKGAQMNPLDRWYFDQLWLERNIK
ncbi:MAG: peptide ABC transporter substrate-binding protein [Deltaproteobacteria bacterium]|nr:peptide ABC transporter substrate-binding protein [Deltaproteobacteria bacterium]